MNLKSKKLMMVFFFTIFQNTFIVQSVLEKKNGGGRGGGEGYKDFRILQSFLKDSRVGADDDGSC